MIAIVTAVLTACILAIAAPAIAAEQALEPLLEPIRIEHGLPALAAAVTRNGRVIAIGATGTRVHGRSIPVTRDDRFHIGSDTKAMTATLAGMMVDAGKLRWESTVGEVLGSDIPGLNPAFAAITLAQLLSHSSGIPSDNAEHVALYFSADGYDYNPDAYRRRIIGILGKHAPVVPQGSPFQYSNFGYTVAGAMIETAAGMPWEAMITQRLFAPLKLTSAGLGPQATFGKIDAPVGHWLDNNTITPRFWGPAADVPAVVGPAGNAHLSIRDFARWAAWNAAEGKRGPPVIKAETLKQLHRPHVKTPVIDNPKPGTPKTGDYGFGWSIVTFPWAGRPMLTHNGSNSMNLASILVDPSRDFSIVVATNFPGEKADLAVRKTLEALYARYTPKQQ